MRPQDGILPSEGKWDKLESPARIADLDPAGTLERIGLGPHATVCDIGAGSGLFSFATSSCTTGPVYAVDTDAGVLEQLSDKARQTGAENVVALPVDGLPYPLEDGSIDLTLLVAVLHEIAEKDALFAEVNRILAPSGRVAVVEFREGSTPMGPPSSRRLNPSEVDRLLAVRNFERVDAFDVGENFYCRVYRREG